MSGVEMVLSMLDKVKSTGGKGQRQWVARCPAHDDREPSMSISEGHNGKVLMSCHRGCEFNEILSALGLSYQQLNPSEPFEVDRVQRARDIWDNAGDGVRHHPYAFRKRITEDFGARRGRGFGRVVGNGSDCIVVPMRSIEGNLVGVELINEDGQKQTFGHKGYLIIGNPESAKFIHVTEGWATLWACQMICPKDFSGVVCFGKARMQECADFADATYPGSVVPHFENDKYDVWDYFYEGIGKEYMASFNAGLTD